MSELEGIVSYTFHWRTSTNPCQKCIQLSYSRFEGQDVYQSALFDPLYGPVWDMDNDLTLAHPHCKCTLEVVVEVDFSKAQWFQDLLTAGLR